MSNRQRKKAESSFGYESLEVRNVLASFLPVTANINASTGELVIRADASSDETRVRVDKVVENGVTTYDVIERGGNNDELRRTQFSGTPTGIRYVGNDNVDRFDVGKYATNNAVPMDLSVVALGNGGNDSLRGTDLDDQLSGGDGNDTLVGFGGTDRLVSGDGNDRIFGEGGEQNIDLRRTAGDDIIFAGPGNDIVQGNRGDDIIDGGDGNDFLEGNDGDDTISGKDGNDRIGGDLFNVRTFEDSPSETQRFVGGNDVIFGDAGDDILRGGIGDDVISGGDGADNLLGDFTTRGNDILFGGSGPDTIDGSHGNDEIYGHDGDDTLNGGTGNDRIFGLNGNDTINGGAGVDSLRGGADDDLLIFDAHDANVDGDSGSNTSTEVTVPVRQPTSISFDAAARSMVIRANANATQTNLDIYDPAHFNTGFWLVRELLDDGSFVEHHEDLDNIRIRYQGNDGADNVFVASGNIAHRTDITLVGNGGNDFLESDARNTVLIGGSGNDELRGGKEQRGGTGNDSLTADLPGRMLMIGDDGADILVGNSIGIHVDLMLGGAGNDQLFGFGGNDRLDGGGGHDQIHAGTGDDFVIGNAGNDRLFGEAGNDLIFGSEGNDRLDGGLGNDTLRGGDGLDFLFGGDGTDELFGGAGEDRLDGQAGRDQVTGNSDRDFFFEDVTTDDLLDFDGSVDALA